MRRGAEQPHLLETHPLYAEAVAQRLFIRTESGALVRSRRSLSGRLFERLFVVMFNWFSDIASIDDTGAPLRVALWSGRVDDRVEPLGDERHRFWPVRWCRNGRLRQSVGFL